MGNGLMNIPMMDSRRIVILAIALALGIWAFFGIADLPNRPHGGFRHDASGVVTGVEEGGPAAQAGLRVGDRILSINGVSLHEATLTQRLPRAENGETRSVLVARADDGSGADTREELEITYSSELAVHPIGLIGGALLALVFLLCGVLAYQRAPSQPSLLFGIVGVCLAGLLLPDPHLPTHGLRSFVEAVKFLAAFPVFACLLHLTMIFPEPRRMLKRKAFVGAIYMPAILLGAAGAIQIVQRNQPGPVVELLGTLALVVYMVLSMVALIHRYATTTREKRVACGLSLLVWGIAIGFGPLVVSAVALLVAPAVPLPGRDYYFLAMVLIPVSFTAALWRWSACAERATADQAAGA
jgi:membrane-associated protease RseP (regulator of RpoE activity)